ncbi:MAG: hypothetical protein V3S01_06825 [Dehalococcoidia bacterium]
MRRDYPRVLQLPMEYKGYMCGPTSVAIALGIPCVVADKAFQAVGLGVTMRTRMGIHRVYSVTPPAISSVLRGFGVAYSYGDLDVPGAPTVGAWMKHRPEAWRRSTVLLATTDHLLTVRGGQVVDTLGGESTELSYPKRRFRVTDVWRIHE